MADNSLRSPHNGHLTILARTGVPGFALWAGMQLAWAAGVFDAFVRAAKAKEKALGRVLRRVARVLGGVSCEHCL